MGGRYPSTRTSGPDREQHNLSQNGPDKPRYRLSVAQDLKTTSETAEILKALKEIIQERRHDKAEPAEKRDTVGDNAEPHRDLTCCPTILIHLPSNPHEPPASRPFRQLLAEDVPYRSLLVQKGGL
ncbi:hypothetical protein KOW79_019626 [Hemibagrus wyckioides]|uniref:Uncharacterized protein n=1 Tax=Hemibagrus wyckioides TaxID=337641 RepID=A0A9D3SF27_9TELE|nr:hypothetical protein KOW79_019626 [Hemibagrus wyckioides]